MSATGKSRVRDIVVSLSVSFRREKQRAADGSQNSGGRDRAKSCNSVGTMGPFGPISERTRPNRSARFARGPKL
jgi:hypothetical protein